MQEGQIAVGIRRAGQMLDISERQLWRQIRAGTLRARHLGGRTVVLVEDLEEFARRGAPVPSSAPMGPKGGALSSSFGAPARHTHPVALQLEAATG